MQRSENKYLVEKLRDLSPTGNAGFEGLIAKLLENLTGRLFFLARSGNQSGRDMRSVSHDGNIVAAECKRYGKQTKLNERELIAELVQACTDIRSLDLWVLVASTTISDQLFTTLQKCAVKEGIELRFISSEDGNPSTLESLCAYGKRTTVDLLASSFSDLDKTKLQNNLEQIENHPDYHCTIKQLQESFSSKTIGYSNWKSCQKQWLNEQFSSEEKSRSTFQQLLNVGDKQAHITPRITIQQELDSWLANWSESNKQFAILGEEGDGKTWAISLWIDSHIKNEGDFPPVLFLSSSRPISTDPGKLLADAIAQHTRFDVEYWEQRLTRWHERPKGKTPLIILVLDGINERREPNWWRTLFEKLNISPWKENIAVLVTARNAYWQRYFSSLRHLNVISSELPPFDDKELNIALKQHGLSLDDIAPTLLPLIRKPRYLDLVVKFRNQMSNSGDITVARLIYEDWRDRWSRKSGLAVDEDQFQSLLKGLANNVSQRGYRLSEKDIADQIPFITDKQPVLDELVSGGVLHGAKGTYKVDESRLVLGFGLLLVDLLKDEYDDQDNLNLEEVISQWLEPQEMDIKARILESAVLDALSQGDDYPKACRMVLLEAWVESKNPQENIADNFTAYLPLHPSSYFKLAEILWSNIHDNPWGQELIMYALLDKKDNAAVQSLFPQYFEYWLGFIHTEGFVFQRQKEKPDKLEELKKAICDRAGENLTLGPINIGEYPLTVIEDDGLLRLGRVALAVMSHLPRGQFLRAVSIGCIAESIMGAADKYHHFAWLVRTSPEPLWEKVKKQVEELINVNCLVTKQAASRLLSFESGLHAIKMKKKFPEDLFPLNPVVTMHRGDPCTSFFAWSRDDCAICLEREDISPARILQRIQRFCPDPDFFIPPKAGFRLANLAESINVEKIWCGRGQTSEDLRLQELELPLCLCDLEKISNLYCSVFRNFKSRTGVALKQLCFKINEYSLLFDDDVKTILHQTWQRLIEHGEEIHEGEEYAEESLFSVLLMGFTAEQQLESLLNRPAIVHELLSFEHSFKLITDWKFVRESLDTDKETNLSRILWFLLVNPKEIPPEIMEIIIFFLTHPSNLLRSIILQILFQREEKSHINSFVTSNWYWKKDQNTLENHWGSLILAKFGKELPFKELCRRAHPLYLGYAVVCRGKDEKECRQYAECINTVLQGCAKAPDLPADFPLAEVDCDIPGTEVNLDRIGLSNDDFSRDVTFFSRDAFWGGAGPNPNKSFDDALKPVTDNQLEELTKIISNSIDEQTKAGNIWFSNSFSDHALDCAIQYCPDLLDSWLPSLNDSEFFQLSHKRSFYETICKILLEVNPAQGVELYRQLTNSNPSVKFIDSHSGIPVLRYSLFSSPSSPEIRELLDECLQQCKTDLDLFELTIVAQHEEEKSWLHNVIEKFRSSDIYFDQARAIMLQGLIEVKENDEWFLKLQANQKDDDTWLGKVAQTALTYRKHNMWSKCWFKRFWNVEQDVQAWASFRLLLKCVDRRFWNWQKEIQPTDSINDPQDCRSIFFKNNISTLKNAIKRNEKNMGEYFLATKVLDNQMWPWMQ